MDARKDLQAVIAMVGWAVMCLVFVAWMYPANAQQPPPCGQADEMIGSLVTKYKEAPVFIGSMKGPDGTDMPIMGYSNHKTGTWTLIARPSPGIVCMVLAGDGFEFFIGDLPKGDPL